MEELKKAELRSIIGQAIGEASMLWSETPKGVFESDKGCELMDRTMKEVLNYSCLKDNKDGELSQENAELLQEIRTLTNERVEIREEIKELQKQINSTIGMNDRDIYWKNFYKMAIQERQIIKQAEEIKRLNIEIIFDLGGILKRDPRSSKVEELMSKYKEGE